MKELSYFEKSEEIYKPFERLEMENEKLREDIKKMGEEIENLKSISPFLNKFMSELGIVIRRLNELETYIHGPKEERHDH